MSKSILTRRVEAFFEHFLGKDEQASAPSILCVLRLLYLFRGGVLRLLYYVPPRTGIYIKYKFMSIKKYKYMK